MSMYDRIKTMTAEEMRHFIYLVYMCGNEDGKLDLQDSPSGFFGGYMLTKNAKEVMPNDDVQDLWTILMKRMRKESYESYESLQN